MEGRGTILIWLALGLAVSLGIALAGGLVTAGLVAGEGIGPEAMDSAAAGIRCLGAFAGATVTAGGYGRRRLPVCLLQGGCYAGLLLALGRLLTSEGEGSGITGMVPVVLGSLAAAGLGAVISGRRPGIPRGRFH